ncbi:hypothetical protein KM043_004730 [Ampulex compressa]|nr:hypothetical protein KM043_004730 [Ampulex compressa]
MSDKQTAPILPPLNGGGSNNGGGSGGTSQQTVSLQQVLATAQGLNVLTTGAGQQFVIASQVPSLTQVIPSGATASSNLQQVGVPRIVNISNTSARSSMAASSPLASPTRQTPTKVVLATSPKLVRTSIGNMFVAPTSQGSLHSPPAKKRLKLSEVVERPAASLIPQALSNVPATQINTSVTPTGSSVALVDDLPNTYRRRIIEHKLKRMRAIRDKYTENASELFFLHAGGNMMDLQAWRKRPATPQYLHFLRQHRLDPDDDDEDLTVPLPLTTEISLTPVATPASTVVPFDQSSEVQISGTGVTPVALSTSLPAAVAQLSQQGGTPLALETSRSSTMAATTPVADKTSMSQITTKPSMPMLTNPQPVVKLVNMSGSTMAMSSDMANNQEQIVEKAKQEAYVMQRITELQREGLWSERRLPKVQEPPRTKAHWDYLLEEMVWLAADFAQERKWKKAAAKKCARMVQKHFQEKAIQAQKAEKSQELRLKKIAGFIAKEIKTFWANVEKLVEYKQQTRLEEKRKKALDQHLNFIVGQTEKYSTWLTEGLNKTEGSQSIPASMNSSRISSPVPPGKSPSDEEFQPNQSSDDDEETIARAEEEMKSVTNHKEEVELLKKESEIPLEDLLKDLPLDYLEDRDKSFSPTPKEFPENESGKTADGDTDFVAASDESSDEEDTIMEQEKLEENADYEQELDELKAENEMSIDELMAKYGNTTEVAMEQDHHDEAQDSDKESSKEEDGQENKEDMSTSSESENEETDNEIAEQESRTQSDAETDIGLKSLLEDLSMDKSSDVIPERLQTTVGEHRDADNEMDNVAALAESIQPKGNTLLTTSVVTKIPFLLKHSLREYQHIGLDWLVTMYDRKLNGILADEMGLGKTIQTIALLAHLACEKGNWGPHLIIVPTSVMLNWEMECKKWCPGFKILTYYGTQKERKQKRTGWTKPNAFHICITSYKLVIQDHQSFRRKKWKYLILDEAQNIKNFKSQRWQLLLNFQTQRRLLLTGTPLQNNLMELWSLMHFLMPNVFQSHREFKEWFSNPVTGMIEGNSEYNENIIRRLHKVLRPFLLRRLKTEVEKQLPKKYEHVVMCRLSKRQRYLYDDFMSRAKTKETLASGNLLSVINVLMQLRKVCNHPNLFEVRPTVSPFQMETIEFVAASLVWSALDYDPFKHVDLSSMNLLLCNLEMSLTAFAAHRIKRLQTPRKLIEEIDSQPDPPPRCPPGKVKINVRLSNQAKQTSAPQPAQPKLKNFAGILPTPRVGTSPLIKTLNNQTSSGQGVTLRVAGGQQLQGYSVQLVQHQGSVKAIPVGTLAHNPQSTTVTSSTAATNAQRITVGNANIRDGLQRLATQTVTVKQGDSLQRIAVPSFAQLVQTSTGRHIILTSNQQNTNTVSFPVMTSTGQRLTVLSKSLMGLSTSSTTVNKVVGGVVTSTSGTSGRPVMRVPPLNVTASQASGATSNVQPRQQPIRCGIVTRNAQKESDKAQMKEQPKSEFHLPQLEEERRRRRQAKLRLLANINERRCAACPLYGEDLFMALRIGKPSTACRWHDGWLHCTTAKDSIRTRRQFFSRTEALAEAIKSTEQIVEELKEVFERFVVYVPAVRASLPRFHVSHPPPHKLFGQRRMQAELQRQLFSKVSLLHPVAGAMMTQFPDPRLIQYDCGKLQSLDHLLRKLKSDNHRVLIFTQMTRMLDVLEAFLNFHGHIYLRLDGTTRVDQRQVLMERFNGDKRIFCFILSTRSGGVGVNLTGADTVIFYDSDWNPTMDAQAQDRCHRIGQTRDVHIYRLVSEKTVEENILKKANQKRLLGDLAIEGGNFTTAYFKSSTIQDLFNIDQTENDASARMAEVLEQSKDREKVLQKDAASVSQPTSYLEEKMAIGALESALAAAEEDLDVQAAKTAKAEAVADLAEFDENIPLDEAEKEEVQVSKAELEVQNLVSQLTPIERYAMKFVEESEGAFSAAQLAAAERELEEQKKEWELDRLRALREEEERRMRLADDEEKPLTFGREDAQNQVNSASHSRKLGNKKLPPSRRSLRRASSRGARESSESETETTTESESESQEDVVEDSLDEESSHTESQSQGDEGEEEEEEDEDEDEEEEEEDDEEEEEEEEEKEETEGRNEKGGGYSKRKNRSEKSFGQNHFDLNSPRTRSRGNVKINLWTLDVSPILPGIKPKSRGRPIRGKRDRSKEEEAFALPLRPAASPKKIGDEPVMEVVRLDSLENEACFHSDSSDSAMSSTSRLSRLRLPTRTVEAASARATIEPKPWEEATSNISSAGEDSIRKEESSNIALESSQLPLEGSNSLKPSPAGSCVEEATIIKYNNEMNVLEDQSQEMERNRSPPVSRHSNTLSTIGDKSDLSKCPTSTPVLRSKTMKCRNMEGNSSSAPERKSIPNNEEAKDKEERDSGPPSPRGRKSARTKQQLDQTIAGSPSSVKSEPSTYKPGLTSVIQSGSSQKLNSTGEESGSSDAVSSREEESSSSSHSIDASRNPSYKPACMENKAKERRSEPINYLGVTTRSGRSVHSEAGSTDLDIEAQPRKVDNLSDSHNTPNKGLQIRRPDTPYPSVEQGRITRSTVIRSFTPPPVSNYGTPKSALQRRRPDTPLPECFKNSPRPVTRSFSIVNSPLRIDEPKSSYEKPTTRSSKSLDNGFLNSALFRHSSPIPTESKEPSPQSVSSIANIITPVITRSKKVGGSEVSTGNTSCQKRSPDTPIPTAEQLSRVTRSGLNFTFNSGKTSPSVVRGSRCHPRRADSSSSSSSSTTVLSTDSNGNAVASEVYQKQQDDSSGTVSALLEPKEKPQRTAKVVAILTLDTLSRSNHGSKSSCSVKGGGSSEGSKSNKKAPEGGVVRLSDITPNCKLDGWCDSELEEPRILSAGYTSKHGKGHTSGKASMLMSKAKTTEKLSVQSAVIALVDLENESNYDSSNSSGNKRLRRKLKRARLAGGKLGGLRSEEEEEEEEEDEEEEEEDEDEEQVPPSKKPVRSQVAAPPRSDKIVTDSIS